MSDTAAIAEFGPSYPALAICNRFRAKARAAGSLADMPRDDVVAYGEAVLAGIRALQRSEAFGAARTGYIPLPSTKPKTGDEILAEIRRAHVRAGEAHANEIRRARTDREIEDDYEEAMAAKRARLEAEARPATAPVPAEPPASKSRAAALKAWETRRRATGDRASASPARQPTAKGRAAALKAWETIRARRAAAQSA